MRSALILSVVLCGCGAADGKFEGESGKDEAPATDPAADPAVEVGKDPAAGTTGDPAASRSKHSLLIEDAAALPPCDEAGENWLVYVKAESKFKTCAAGAWTDVDLKPFQNRIVGSIGCGGELEDTGVWFSYNAAQMASGDVFVNGSISEGSIEVGNTAYFSVQQNGFLTAPVLFNFDLSGDSNGGYFTISLDRASLKVTIRYKDSDGDKQWVQTPDTCVVNQY